MMKFYICRSCGLFFITGKDKRVACPCCGGKDIKSLRPISNVFLSKLISEPSENGFVYKGNDFSFDYFGKDNLPPHWDEMLKWCERREEDLQSFKSLPVEEQVKEKI